MTDTLGPYELVELLGKGGMGEVHLARDTRLQREVALKLLPPDLADDPERRARFLREARAAAALNHPNITTILDVGEEAGRDYIAQEYLDGRPLNEIVADRKLPLAELAGLAVPLADALAYAHEQGVIHRDLKAGNVIVNTRGDPKLLDFGLAKVLHGDEEGLAREDDQSTTLTMSGQVFGTPSAMSPEQALGKVMDARADVFSFGALLYEMATGKPAFLGATIQETMDKVLNRQPEPLAQLRRDLPSDFVQIVEKALRKDPDERYQSMAEMAADLRHFKRQTDSGVVPPATVGDWPSGRQRAVRMVGIVLLVAVVAWVARDFLGFTGGGDAETGAPLSPAAVGPSPVAVLLVENASDPADGDKLAAMLARLLTTDLADADDLEVVSKQKLFDTARQLGREDGTIDRASATDVARAAGVATMILGEVDTFGDMLVASTEIVDVASGRALGNPKAKGQGIDEIFSLAEDLGRQVRAALGATAAPAARQVLAENLTSSVDAYRSYVLGKEAFMRWEFEDAVAHFREATRLDPAFALGHYWHAIAGSWRQSETGEETVAAAERAAAFRDRLPPEMARVADAVVHFSRQDSEKAIPLLEAVLAADPDNRDALYMLGEQTLHSATLVDPDKSAECFRRLLELDPSFVIVRQHVIRALCHAGRVDEALAEVRTYEDADGEPASLPHSLALAFAGRIEEARQMWTPRPHSEIAQMLTVIGHGVDDPLVVVHLEVDEVDTDLATVPNDPEATQLDRINLFLRLMLLGRLREAEETFGPYYEAAPPPKWAYSGSWVMAHGLVAELRVLTGDLAGARRASRHLVQTMPGIPQGHYLDAVLAAMDGDVATVEARHRALVDLAVGRSPHVAAYRDCVEAELAMLGGDPARARELYASVVGSGVLRTDWYASGGNNTLWAHWRFAEACKRDGDMAAARVALQPIGDPCMDWFEAIFWLQITHDLGVMELDAGNEARGRELLQRVLDWWDGADVDVEIVRSARERLG